MFTNTELSRLKKFVARDNDRLVKIFDTLGDANRCKLFRLAAKNGDINVTGAAQALAISVPLASQHLKILQQNKLLVKNKRGREVFYSLNESDQMILSIIKVIKN